MEENKEMNNSSLNLFLVTLLLINKTFANDVQSSNEIHRQFTPRLMASKVLKDYNVDDCESCFVKWNSVL